MLDRDLRVGRGSDMKQRRPGNTSNSLSCGSVVGWPLHGHCKQLFHFHIALGTSQAQPVQGFKILKNVKAYLPACFYLLINFPEAEKEGAKIKCALHLRVAHGYLSREKR